MLAFNVKLLKNSLPLKRIINYTTHWHTFAILLKEIILHFEFQRLFLNILNFFKFILIGRCNIVK